MFSPRHGLMFLLALCACEPDCPDPTEVDGSWRMTMVVLESEGGDVPGFPSYRSPSNGDSDWTLQWGDLGTGPVSVQIGDSMVRAEGVWDQDSCGSFELAVEGPYDSPSGSRHLLDGTLNGVYWEGIMDGQFTWVEDWSDRNREDSGRFSAQGRFEAIRE